jgi:hypothetical protein
MRLVIRALVTISLIACSLWAFNKPGWDSICAAIGALVVLAMTFFPSPSMQKTQSQTVGNGSTGIQIGEGVNIKNKTKKRK